MGDGNVRHRGLHPGDDEIFCEDQLPDLRAAVEDYSWLLDRGYAEPSTLKLVGDRYQLRARQRDAVSRCSASTAALERRSAHHARVPGLEDAIYIDGYNLLITLETALSGGVILRARDGCFRDLASLHGTYRSVEETTPAIELVGEALHDRLAFRGKVFWYLDAPVSNSGRLAGTIREAAARRGWTWEVLLVPDPDPVLADQRGLVSSSDSWILDRCQKWFNLALEVLEPRRGEIFVVDLSPAKGIK